MNDEQQNDPPKGFISAPTPEQLKPTPRERDLLERLWIWQEQSAKSRIILGKPMNAEDQQ